MKFKSSILYLVGILLFLLGNRDLWAKLQQEQQEQEKKDKAFADAALNLKNKFEVQTLAFDPETQQWKNPHFYFQVFKGALAAKTSKTADKSAQEPVRTKVETNDDENASDSN